MKRNIVVMLMTIAYLVLLAFLFKGIKWGEARIKDAWYSNVTKRMSAKASHVPIDNCILGIYKPELPYSFDGMKVLEDSLDTRFTLVSFYQAWGDGPEQAFPASLMNAIDDKGCVPVLTWEPWVTDFGRPGLKSPGKREHRYLKDIAEGRYDFHIVSWAKGAVTWGKPFFLRFAHEMSNPQYPWTPVNDNRPEDYIRAWWHVHRVFDSLGATNVIWVWCPYKPGDLVYYPGDTCVDWTAIDVFNYGDLLSEDYGPRWLSFDQLASPLYRSLVPLRKPIMVAEVGSSDMGGSRDSWYREMLKKIPEKFPSIKAVVFFENPADQTSGRWTIDWSIQNDRETMLEVNKMFFQGYFSYQVKYSQLLSQKTR
jgi:hypothetical protein